MLPAALAYLGEGEVAFAQVGWIDADHHHLVPIIEVDDGIVVDGLGGRDQRAEVGDVQAADVEDVSARAALEVADGVGAVASPEDEGVAAAAAGKPIAAEPAVEAVAAGAALQGVVAGAASEAVVATEADDNIVAAGRGLGEVGLLEVGVGPARAVGEADLLDAVCILLVKGDAVGRALDRENDVVGVGRLADGDIGGGNPGAEDQAVAAAAIVVDDVLAVAAAEQVGVAAGAALQGVVAGAAARLSSLRKPTTTSLPLVAAWAK